MATPAEDVNDPDLPFIFVVHSDRESELARALNALIQSWGFRVRREIAHQPYGEVAEDLRRSDLVILLLSNEFERSRHCQAEAGAAVASGTRQIQVIIPPVGRHDLAQVCPAAEGRADRELIDGSKPQLVVTQLRSKLGEEFGRLDLPRPEIPDTASLREEVRRVLADLIEAYSIEPPVHALIGAWPSLTDPRTPHSIIQHIKRAVAEGETNLAVVGVSLKYSLDIITNAIEALASAKPSGGIGPLTVELAHMDDQSQILHSLADTIDINSIIRNFHVGWATTKSRWIDIGKSIGVTINVKDPIAIDYIPQQVGVRVHSVNRDWSVLYAGRCSFQHAGDSGTRLLVGEGEYLFYTSWSPGARGADAISVFNQYLDQYRSPRHNGATIVPDRNDWLGRLETCVSTYQNIDELVLVSNTGAKLLPMVAPALRRGIPVRVYTSSPDLELLPEIDAAMVRLLKARLRHATQSARPGSTELRYFYRLPTFRAALIGDAVLGFQAYTVEANNEAATALIPSELRLIVTGNSQHFESLREMVFGFLHGAQADRNPYAVLPEPPS